MAFDIGPRIGIDGESEFRKQLNNINTGIKTLGTEMQKVTSDFGDNANGQQALIAKNEVLNKTIEEQKRKLAEVAKALESSEQKYGKNSNETLKWQQVMNRTQTELNKLETEVKQNEDALDEMDKGLRDAETGLKKVENGAEDAKGGLSTFKDVLKAELIVEGIKGIASAIKGVVEETQEYRRIMASLEISSKNAGYSAEETAGSYRTLYGVLGDDQTAATTTANLQALGLSQKQLTQLTNGAIGAWATYGDSIPIDGLAEAINETAKAGAVTGTFADVLNWAGTSEDDFNAKLEKCGSESERANLILQELANQGLIKAGEGWQKQNEDIVKSNQATADFNDKMSEVAERVSPIATELQEGFNKVLEKLLELTENVDFSKVSEGISAGFTFFVDTVIPKILEFGEYLIENKDTIIGAVTGIGAGFVAWNVTNMIQGVVGKIKEFSAATEGASIAQKLLNGAMKANPIGIIITVIATLVTAVVTLWNTNEEFRAAVIEIWGKVKEAFSKAIQAIVEFFEKLRKKIIDTWNSITGKISGAVNSIIQFFNNLKSKVQSIWNSITSKIVGAATGIRDKAVGAFNNMVSGIRNTVGKIRDVVVNGFNGAIDFITSLPSRAVQWGRDFIQGLINGIKNMIGGIIDAVSSVASTITSFLHFSVPDVGPLTSAPEWMPDMIDLMVSGLKKSEPKLRKTVSGIAGSVKDAMNIDGDIAIAGASNTQVIYLTTQTVLDGKIAATSTTRVVSQRQIANSRARGKHV